MISKIAFDQFRDHLDHAREIAWFCCAWVFVRAFDSQSIEILKKSPFKWFGEIVQRNFRLPRPANGFVIDIGNVHHPMHFEAAHFEVPLQQIFENVGAKISDVSAAVNRRPAGVDVDLAILRVARLKFFDLARVGIKKAKRH